MRLLVLVGALAGVVALAGHAAGGTVLGGTWLTATLGPTAYALVADPHGVTSQLGNAVIGHVATVLAGVGALAVPGLWNAPSVAETHSESVTRILAQAVAVGVTLLLLTLLEAHHAPAAATALLMSSGIAGPGRPLAGLVVGLVIVLVLAPLLARLPGRREDTDRVDAQQAER